MSLDTILRPVASPLNCPFSIRGLALGLGTSPLEVLVADSTREPRVADVRGVWQGRQGGRAAPLLLLVFDREKATLCGPTGDEPPVATNLDPGQAERLCREALSQPDRHAALR